MATKALKGNGGDGTRRIGVQPGAGGRGEMVPQLLDSTLYNVGILVSSGTAREAEMGQGEVGKGVRGATNEDSRLFGWYGVWMAGGTKEDSTTERLG